MNKQAKNISKTTGAICFDGQRFYNKQGIEALGLSSEDAQSVYRDLIEQEKLTYDTKAYFFFDEALNLKHSFTFRILKITDNQERDPSQPPFWLESMILLLTRKFRFTQVKVVGFFRIEKPDLVWTNTYRRLTPLTNTYLNSTPFTKKSTPPLLVHHERFYDDINLKLPLPKDSTYKDIDSLYYFHSEDVFKTLAVQAKNFSPDLVPEYIHLVYREGFPTNETTERKGKKFRNMESIDLEPNYKNRASPQAMEVMLAAAFKVLKTETGYDDETIIEIAKNMLPQGCGKGLSTSKVKGVLSRGRATLGIAHPERSKK